MVILYNKISKQAVAEMEKVHFPGQISEFKEGNDIYYVRVTDIRRSGDYAPVESVSEVIKRVLFNQRKQDIIKAHEDSLYRQALSKKQIYVHAN